MRNSLLYFLLLVVALELVTIFLINSRSDEAKVLAVSTIQPTQTPTQTPSPKPTISPSPKPTTKPTISPSPQPTFSSQQINELINEYAGKYGVSPDVMRHMALCESGFNPLATTLSYQGLFQYGPTTWKNIRGQMNKDTDMNLRLNAKEAIETTAYALSVGKKSLWPNCVP